MIRRAVAYVSDLVNGSKKGCPKITLNRARGFSKILSVLKQHGYVLNYEEDMRKHTVVPGEMHGYYRKGWTHGLAFSSKGLRSLHSKLIQRNAGILIVTAPSGLKVYESTDNSGGIPLVYVY